jgi:hypothetical protein
VNHCREAHNDWRLHSGRPEAVSTAELRDVMGHLDNKSLCLFHVIVNIGRYQQKSRSDLLALLDRQQ